MKAGIGPVQLRAKEPQRAPANPQKLEEPVHLQWMALRDCSSFPIKRNKQTYSTEPSNLQAPVQHTTVGVEPMAHGKGVAAAMKQRSSHRKLATSYVQTTMNKSAQGPLSSIRYTILEYKFGPDLRTTAVRRAPAILLSQKPVMEKRQWARPTESSWTPARHFQSNKDINHTPVMFPSHSNL
ncbi:60S ribosomal protein L28-like [Ursus americanus]|uniref:60S ribosomal protein L28-like n=1 Tax=Ursus americanus TaxID=9643 RepID=UPI001E67CC8B|nr:60S ribosomal protein L28-like [Ursus americanus]